MGRQPLPSLVWQHTRRIWIRTIRWSAPLVVCTLTDLPGSSLQLSYFSDLAVLMRHSNSSIMLQGVALEQ